MLTAELTADRELAALGAGLDALEQQPAVPRSRWREIASSLWPPLAAAVVFVGLWQLAVSLHVKEGLLPGPLDVAHSFGDQWRAGYVLGPVWTTLHRAAIGYAVSLVLGTLLGLAMGRIGLLRRALGPYLAALQSLPSVAWVPFAILAFGINEGAIYFVVILGALPSIANGLLAGIDQIPPLLLQVGDAMGARGLRRIRHILMPAALPGYIAGLKQAWAFSWRSLMAAEIIAGGPDLGLGLGQFLHNGLDLSDFSLVIVAMLLMLAVGILVDVLVFAPLDRGVRRRRGLLVSS